MARRPVRRVRRRGVLSRHRGDELIAPPVASLDELRVFGIVAEDAAQLLNARREGVVGHRDVWPHGRKQVAFRHGGTGMRHEERQHVRGLGRQAHLLPAEPQLARLELETVFAEADALGHGAAGSQYKSGPARDLRSYALTSSLTSRDIDLASASCRTRTSVRFQANDAIASVVSNSSRLAASRCS